jgi:putative oxidoreductase
MNNLDSWSPKVLSVLRFVTGLMFLEHGLQKIFHFPPPPPPPPGAAAAAAGAAHGLPPMIMAAGWIEIVCGILIALGLFGRAAAFIASGEMAVAYFMAHAPRNPFPVNNQGDAAILYCFFFLLIVFTGPGPLSIDGMMKKKI